MDTEWRGPKKTWTDADWTSYRKQSFMMRRMIDFFFFFSGITHWMVKRMIAKADAGIERTEKIGRGIDAMLAKSRKRHPVDDVDD